MAGGTGSTGLGMGNCSRRDQYGTFEMVLVVVVVVGTVVVGGCDDNDDDDGGGGSVSLVVVVAPSLRLISDNGVGSIIIIKSMDPSKRPLL